MLLLAQQLLPGISGQGSAGEGTCPVPAGFLSATGVVSRTDVKPLCKRLCCTPCLPPGFPQQPETQSGYGCGCQRPVLYGAVERATGSYVDM